MASDIQNILEIRNYSAVDVELANDNLSSICEIGIANFCDDELISTYRTLINPEGDLKDVFHFNVHGISKTVVKNAPIFPDIYEILRNILTDRFCIFHAESDFDFNCISKACVRYGLEDFTQDISRVSTLTIARKVYPGLKSYKLESLCKSFEHVYIAHNALEDAIASAVVFRKLKNHPMPAIGQPPANTSYPRSFRTKISARGRNTGIKANQDGKFANVHIVLSGVFSAPWEDRKSFELFLAELGFVPRAALSGKTEILVIGEDPGPSKINK